MKYKENIACVILGGYVNGYSIIQELAEHHVPNIVLVDDKKDVAWKSRLLAEFVLIPNFQDYVHLKRVLVRLCEKYEDILVFPTKDEHLNVLKEILEICSNSSMVHVMFDIDTIVEYQKKSVQYEFCERLGVPYPKSKKIGSYEDICQINNLVYPLLVKPVQTLSDFRNRVINTPVEFCKLKECLVQYLEQGVEFLVSELIPGEGDQIYAYMSYVNKNGKILGEWTGRKLAQFPNNFGVFSSAMAVDNEEVMNLGRKLVSGMGLKGITEPEFKYDSRDGKYKLMEVNLRSMMWNRVGALSGMPLHYMQYLDFIGANTSRFKFAPKDLHYVYLQYELLNLFIRSRYWSIFKFNVFKGKERVFALRNKEDKSPFWRGWILLVKKIIKKSSKYKKL